MAVEHHLGNRPAAVPKAGEGAEPPFHDSDSVVQESRIIIAS
jgi:hypothetical protein